MSARGDEELQPRRGASPGGATSARSLLALDAVDAVDAYYDRSHVLQSLSLEVESGAVVALLGRNGAGKSTTLKTVMGIVPARAGSGPTSRWPWARPGCGARAQTELQRQLRTIAPRSSCCAERTLAGSKMHHDDREPSLGPVPPSRRARTFADTRRNAT